VDQQADLATTCCSLDPIRAVDEVARACLHSQPVKGILAERALGQLAKIRRNTNVTGFECALQGRFELAPGIRAVEFATRNADPRASSGGSCANVGCNAPVGPQSKPDEIVSLSLAPAKDARAFGPMSITIFFARRMRRRFALRF
jgi:hypothetical protein